MWVLLPSLLYCLTILSSNNVQQGIAGGFHKDSQRCMKVDVKRYLTSGQTDTFMRLHEQETAAANNRNWDFSSLFFHPHLFIFMPTTQDYVLYQLHLDSWPLGVWQVQQRQAMSWNPIPHPKSYFQQDHTKVKDRGTGLSKSLFCHRSSGLDGNLPSHGILLSSHPHGVRFVRG